MHARTYPLILAALLALGPATPALGQDPAARDPALSARLTQAIIQQGERALDEARAELRTELRRQELVLSPLSAPVRTANREVVTGQSVAGVSIRPARRHEPGR